MKKIILLLTFFTASFAFGQDYSAIIDSYLTNNRSQFGLQEQDIQDVKINSQHFSESMQSEMVYASQRYQGIEIFNSVSSFGVKNGNVTSAAMSFYNNINTRINTTNPSITAAMAIANAAGELGIQNPSNLVLLETVSNQSFVFSSGNISLENIPVKLVLQPTEENAIRLAWDLSIYLLDASHWYSVRIDAVTGQLISTHDWVVNCSFGEGSHSHENQSYSAPSILFSADVQETENALGGNQYRVFPMPVESPNHGSDALVSDPADANASPFGWHDTNGAAGHEFTITRGNNVWAQDDINGNNGTGFSPDGGATLDFDFNHNPNTSPVNRLEGAIVNLFYWNNLMHDVWYQYGFDETSGNFQENNYGNGGLGGDSVDADAQDGSGLNNANFATPPEGQNPRMQMFLWNAVGPPGNPLTINNGPLAGDYPGISATFGAPLSPTPITADLALVEDDDSGPSSDPNDGCDVITNAGQLNGKIVVIRRGECEFGFKVLNAENAGAIAVIVVNNVAGTPIAMGPGVDGASVTIPSIMVEQGDGEAIITALEGGATINASLVEAPPFMIDGDLDSGIVAHEYGHGISNRLTGNNVGCLQNEDQMGEGWSDWFGLMLTMEPGDEGADPRGIGTYVFGQPVLGQGLRAKRYSTDFAINDFTYADSNTQPVPHGLGSVWATMLWDLTWALIDEYGFDSDFYNGTGGNNIAMQLVIDGLKLQPCNPGSVTGRNAILAADEAANAGANRCLIWQVFANRGLGFSASQGSANNSNDQVEAFDLPAECQLGTNDNGSLDNNFIIYPNPSNGDINIMTRVDVGNAEVSILDMNGRKVFSQEVDLRNKVNINASGLKTGIYLLQIDGANHSHTAKLIIQ